MGATSSTRRRAQLLHHRPDLKVVEIRGNVGTRLRKLSEQTELDAIGPGRPLPVRRVRGERDILRREEAEGAGGDEGQGMGLAHVANLGRSCDNGVTDL